MMLGTITDKKIKIVPSANMLKTIRKIDEKMLSHATSGIKSIVADDACESLLEIGDLRWLQKEFLAMHPPCYLHEMLKDCEIKLPEPHEYPRNPELEARVQQLRKEQDKKAYKMMTKNVDNRRIFEPEETISYQIKMINKQLIAVAQFIFSVVAGFAFGFIGVELIVGNLDFGFRLLLGVICSLIIALAEIYFLAKKLSEDMYDDKPHQD